jgi:osmotically inducible protein OsmC
MKIIRTGSAHWQGGIKDGKGAISTQSGALKAYPYGFSSRFEGLPGTILKNYWPVLMLAASPWLCR